MSMAIQPRSATGLHSCCWWDGSQQQRSGLAQGNLTLGCLLMLPGVQLFWEWPCSVLLTDSGLLVCTRSSSPTLRTSWKSIRIFWLPWNTAYTPSLSLSTNLGMFS